MVKRHYFIDAIKGLAILMVVLSHTLPYHNFKFFYNLIYSVQMPIFMFVSGYLFSKHQKIDREYIVKKAKYLLIPYVFFAIINYLVETSLYKKNISLEVRFFDIIKNSIGAPWFLFILFLIYLFFYFHQYIQKNIFKVLNTTIILVIMFYLAEKYNIISLKLFITHLPNFSAGYFFYRWRDKNDFKVSNTMLFFLIFVFCILLSHYNWYSIPSFLDVNSFYYSRALSLITWRLYNFFTGLIGTLVVFFLFEKNIGQDFLFGKLGRNTMFIYLLHPFFIFDFKIENTIVEVLARFSVSFGITLMLLKLYRFAQKKMNHRGVK